MVLKCIEREMAVTTTCLVTVETNHRGSSGLGDTQKEKVR